MLLNALIHVHAMFGFAQRSLLTLSRIWTSSTRFLHNNFRLLTLITGLRLSATAITLPHHHQWPLTDQQVYRRTHDFFNSIDDGAIRALGARHHPRHLPCEIKVRYRGTFNGCFVIEHSDGTTRVVRVALEPAVQDAWDKVRSEVCTMKYVRLHSHIPVPRVYAYGRSKLCRFTSELQVFIIMEQMEGVPLTREALEASSTPRLRFFLNQLVDVLAEFRKLSFTRGGSLMPSDNDEEDMELGNPPVKMVGAFSIRKNEFQATGYKIRRIVTTSAKQFLDEQVRILRHMWTMPYQYLNRREAELEQFALEFMSQPEVQDRVCINSDPQSFLLVHPDLRLGNVLVDDKLRICGIIDWEYTASVPQCVFTPRHGSQATTWVWPPYRPSLHIVLLFRRGSRKNTLSSRPSGVPKIPFPRRYPKYFTTRQSLTISSRRQSCQT
ncbi:kinase-like domain-containing protein [Bombardia bombarda]|uniref:Kinase-like domain-containing protein n=1 Tax=Bombardia bombarda TaxID=252184 RepID=A0AA39WB94_9PEZI|nr:kinase-like domain-containing protein [Bombardia bombarda]